MKIVGLKELKGTSRKTGKPVDAVIVSAVYEDKDTIGEAVLEQYVGRDVFDKAAAGVSPAKLVGRECSISYDRRGFLSEFVLR